MALGVGFLFGFPPFLHFATEKALPLLGFSGTVQSVRGHLLFGLRLEGVDLASKDLRLQAKRLWVSYDLLGLLRRELPLGLRLEGARLEPTWEALIPEAKPPPSAVRAVVRSLVLRDVEVALPKGRRLLLPPLRLTVSGENPYRFLARLPGGSLQGEARALDKAFTSWEVGYQGEVRALAFYYPEVLGGRAEGVWRVGPSGVVGENRLRGGRLRLVGFEISEVEGPVAFKDDRVLARLKGVGLQGPVEAQAEVDLKASRYRFQVQARPSLPALARHFRLALPVEGQGVLHLRGEGWERLHLEGAYRGGGRFLGQPLTLSGGLGFDGVFWLKGQAESRYLDRAYRVRLDLRGGRYQARLEDALGSRVTLFGEGVRTRAQGEVVWPRPLQGRARVVFQSEGDAWRARVESPGVGLVLTRGLDLSGSLEGKGNQVKGRLGPVGLSGSWDALQLFLAPTPLSVGSLKGEGRLQRGRLEARLSYDSPYAAAPLRLWQAGGGEVFLEAPGALGVYKDGVFRLDFQGFPVEVGDRFLVFGRAVYQKALSGTLRVEGRYAEARLDLFTLGARIRGEVRTPLGARPFSGVYDEKGLRLFSEGLSVTYASPQEGLRVRGGMALGGVRLQADFGYREGFWGWASLDFPPYQRLLLLGEGKRVRAEARGLLEGRGEVYPRLRLSGRVNWGLEGLELPPLAFALDPGGVRLYASQGDGLRRVGEVRPDGGFSARIAGRYRGEGFALEAAGGLGQGRILLSTRYGKVRAEGPWRSLALSGRLFLPYLGEGRLAGNLNLPALRPQALLTFPQVRLSVRGEGGRLRFTFSGLGGRAWGAGFYDGRLRYAAFFNEADLGSFGLPLRLSGRFEDTGGRLKASSPYGQALLEGKGPLSARVFLDTLYATGEGELGPEGARLSLHLKPPFQGTLSLEGPWRALALKGEGRVESGVGPLPFTLWAGLEEGQLRYRVRGPLTLEGEGASYQGVLHLPFEALGRRGEVKVGLEGKGGRFQAQGEGVWAGVPFHLGLSGQGLALPALKGALRLPAGEVVLEGGRVRLDLGLAPLGQALGAQVEGRVAGTVDLRGMGEVLGEGRAFGEVFRVSYRDRALEVFWPKRGLGVGLSEEGLWGLGGLSGRVGFRPFGGRLVYGRVLLDLAGSFEKPEGRLAFPGGWLTFSADLGQKRAQGRLVYTSPWAEGEMALSYRDGVYEGTGRLRSLAYLKQEGPLRLFGEGPRARLSWEAPLRVVLAYDREASIALTGEGEAAGVRVKADLSYAPSLGYRGGVWAQGYGLVLEGRGREDGVLGLSLKGEGLWGQGRLEGLDLSLDLAYRRALGQARLEAQGRAQGSLWALVERRQPARCGEAGAFCLQGEGVLIGGAPDRGGLRREGFSFAYDGVPRFLAPGLGVVLEGERLRVDLDRDLSEFGLPVRLRLKGEGPWREAVLSAELLRPEGRLQGEVWPGKGKAVLAGEVLGEKVEVRYEKGLSLRFLGPRLSGKVTYQGGLSGRVGVDLPLPQGGLRGAADLEGGLSASLEGYGAWSGRVGASWEAEGLTVQADLAWSTPDGGTFRGYRLEGGWRYAGGVEGVGWLKTPYGGVRIVGRGEGLDLMGEGLPLSGRVELSPFLLRYRYDGDLPMGLGHLEAEGVYPGVWLKGTYRGYGQTLRLKGEGSRLSLQGEGLEGRLGPDGVFLRLEGFALGPLSLLGRVEGGWDRLDLGLKAQAFGRESTLEGVWNGGLRARLSGDLEGEVVYQGQWAGEVRFKEGRLALSGKGLPRLEGEVLGLSVKVSYPEVEVSGLRVDLAARKARGRAVLFGVESEGVGEEVRLAYPPLGAFGVLSLKDLSLRAGTQWGKGEVVYAQGQVKGRHTLTLGPLSLTLEGTGDGLALSGRVEATPWWPEEVGIVGKVGLDLAYSVRLKTGEEVVEALGQGGSLRLSLSGPYGKGRVAWPERTGGLELDLPLHPLESRLRLLLQGDLGLEGVLEGGVGRVEVSGRLWPLDLRAQLAEARLENFLGRYAPYLRGFASGGLSYQGGRLSLDLRGEAQVGAVRLPFALAGGGGWGALEGEGQLGQSRFRLAYKDGVLEGAGRTQAFPLHALLAALTGPLKGEAYWTGAFRFRWPKDLWQAQAVLVGEHLRFVGGGDELSGRAAFRFQGGRFSVDELALFGKGTWKGGGYWSREGADLRLSLKDTVFTPVLQVVPALRPYVPEGSGSVEFDLVKQNGTEALSVALEAFRFKLGPVEGYLPKGTLRLNGGAQAEGEVALLKPFPGKGVLGLEGNLKSFTLSARGRFAVPGLKEEEPFFVAFRYPGYGLEVRYAQALAQGTAYPLRMAAYGSLPVQLPRYYLLEGLVNIRSAFLYEDKGVYHLTGDLEVVKARLGLPQGAKEVALPAPKGEASGRVPLVFESLRLRAERGVVIQEALAQGELYGEAYLQGPYQNPYLTGEVRALWGSFRLWDQVFTLDPRASYARFTPQGGLLPEVHLVAQSTVRGYAVRLEAEGSFVREKDRVRLKLDPRFTSDPPLDTLPIYALLTLGTTEVTRLTETVPQAVLGAAFQSFLLGQLEREVSRALGLDRLQVETPVFQGGSLEETRFTVGKYLTPELFLGYQIDLRGEQALAAEYRREGVSLAFSATLAEKPRTLLSLGYSLTPSLDLLFNLESNEATRFSVGLAYRF